MGPLRLLTRGCALLFNRVASHAQPVLALVRFRSRGEQRRASNHAGATKRGPWHRPHRSSQEPLLPVRAGYPAGMQEHHKPLRAYRAISLAAFLCLLVAFILQLLVSLSTPIIKSVYLVRVESTQEQEVVTSIATGLRFGVWGVCANSELDEEQWYTNTGYGKCFGPTLGYEVPTPLSDALGISASLTEIVLQGLLVVLVLHPITCAFTFLALIPALFLASHALSVVALVLSVVGALVGTTSFAFDVAIAANVKFQLDDLTEVNAAAYYGSAVWMVLVSIILTWAAVVLLSARSCYCLGVRNVEDLDYRAKQKAFEMERRESQ
ncbi:SUR7/PalI family-domain-containing protein [Schizophyllum commune]